MLRSHADRLRCATHLFRAGPASNKTPSGPNFDRSCAFVGNIFLLPGFCHQGLHQKPHSPFLQLGEQLALVSAHGDMQAYGDRRLNFIRRFSAVALSGRGASTRSRVLAPNEFRGPLLSYHYLMVTINGSEMAWKPFQ